jgi:hypothetical protein
VTTDRLHRAFRAFVRVLDEGVGKVGERRVEAVSFAVTRGSQVEIVQNMAGPCARTLTVRPRPL